MKKNSCYYLILLIFLLNFNFTYSQIVSADKAYSAAFSFMNEMNPKIKSIKDLQLVYTDITSENEPVWYIFSTKKRGFIIISAEMSAYPVLGYSYDSPFNSEPSDFPPAFRVWMNGRSAEIIQIRQEYYTADKETIDLWNSLLNSTFDGTKMTSKNVQPLLYCKWGQGCYYNEMCPVDAAGPCGRVYTGCVSTAMSQIMYYWRHPQTGNGSHSYFHPNYGTLSANFGATTYKWDEMLNSLNSSNPEVARLLFHTGVSVQMNYGPDGSGAGADDARFGFIHDFKYNCSSIRDKSEYTPSGWENLLKSNLNNKRPIFYFAADYNFNAHAFVCDGYQGNNHFHFNWGWDGDFDGYYYINNLNPDNENFTPYQAALTDIYPATSYPLYCSGQKILTALSGSFDDGSGPAYNYQPNSNCSWLINPSGNISHIKLSFLYFETENANDIVTVYDGSTTASPVLGTFSGNTLPNDIQGTAQTMLVTFTSNGSIENKGFLAEYYATISTERKANFLEKNIHKVDVYPNPSDGIITVEIPSTKNAQIKLINILGKELETFEVYSKIQKINLKNNYPGLYLLEISFDNQIVIKKITIY